MNKTILNRISLLIPIVIIALLLIIVLIRVHWANKSNVSIFITQEFGGSYTNCGCGTFPPGGLIKIAWYLEQIRNSEDLIIDAGNFNYQENYTTNKAKGFDPFLESILQYFNQLDYDAVNLGARDLLPNPDLIIKLANSYQISLLSANMIRSADSSNLVQSMKVINHSQKSILVVGVTEGDSKRQIEHKLSNYGIVITDPVFAAKSHMPSVYSSDTLAVLLADVSENTLRKLQSEAQNYDIIVWGRNARRERDFISEMPPWIIKSMPLREGFSVYSRVGDPNIKATRFLSYFLDKCPDREYYNNIARRDILGSALWGISFFKGGYEQTYQYIVDYFTIESKSLQTAITEIEETESFRSKIHTETLKEYVGYLPCSLCHYAEYTSWDIGSHSNLLRNGQALTSIVNNPACYSCHFTGPIDMVSYFSEDTFLADLKGVQCEACHGPGRNHIRSQGIIKMPVDKPSDTCDHCHQQSEFHPKTKTVHSDVVENSHNY